ncbi:transposase [Fimbriiglobus ruber]|uniref:transposase n=1 Tax=Fimbriiglobus ruber TaxID=1908690 RepID=UPI00117A9CFD
MHVHFEVLRGIPVKVTVTPGNRSETVPLRAMLIGNCLYVIDRGYAEYRLFEPPHELRTPS